MRDLSHMIMNCVLCILQSIIIDSCIELSCWPSVQLKLFTAPCANQYEILSDSLDFSLIMCALTHSISWVWYTWGSKVGTTTFYLLWKWYIFDIWCFSFLLSLDVSIDFFWVFTCAYLGNWINISYPQYPWCSSTSWWTCQSTLINFRNLQSPSLVYQWNMGG